MLISRQFLLLLLLIPPSAYFIFSSEALDLESDVPCLTCLAFFYLLLPNIHDLEDPHPHNSSYNVLKTYVSHMAQGTSYKLFHFIHKTYIRYI